MRPTVIFAAVVFILAVAALIYGIIDGPPVPTATDERSLQSEANAPDTNSSRLPPNARPTLPGERQSTGQGLGSPGPASQPGDSPDASRSRP